MKFYVQYNGYYLYEDKDARISCLYHALTLVWIQKSDQPFFLCLFQSDL